MRKESLEDWLPLRGRWLRYFLKPVGWACKIAAWCFILNLVAIVVYPFHPYNRGPRPFGKGQVATAKIQINSFRTALELYRMDNGRVPTTEQGLVALVVLRDIPPRPARWAGPYLKDCSTIPPDPWGNPYQYRALDRNGSAYHIVSYGSDGAPGGKGYAEDLESSLTPGR